MLLATVATFLVVAVGLGMLRITSTSTKITVDLADQRGEISPLVYGTNHRYAYDGFGMYAPQAGQAYPEFIDEVRRSGLSAIRFPGGTIANTYHWKRAIGPVTQRERNVHGTNGQPLTNEYGPDEHARFAEQVGATTNVVVNFGSGSAAEASDWVEYMNAPVGANPNGGTDWAAVRAANGHPEPYGIIYWEVGNEMQYPRQRYWMGEGAAAEIASKYAFGGSTEFSEEKVGGKYADHRERAAVSDGTKSQVFYTKYPPVQPDTQSVFVDGEEWEPAEDLEGVGPENAYRFEPETGEIVFGDGEKGNVPPKGATVTISYVSGPHDGFVDFYEAMKLVDPSIKVCSGLESVEFLAAMGSDNPYDCLAVHRYGGPPGGDDHPYKNLTAEEVHDRIMLEPEQKAAQAAQTKKAVLHYAGSRADGIELVVTEYGLSFGSPSKYVGPTDTYLLSQDQALYVAQSLMQWIELGIPLANKHSLIDFTADQAPRGSKQLGSVDQAIIGPRPHFIPSATARVFELFTSTTGGDLVSSTLTNNPERQISDESSLGLLQTLASTDGEGDAYLMVINRDREMDVEATVELLGYEYDRSAVVRTLNGPSFLSYNTPEDPDEVSIEEEEVRVDSSSFEHTFPAHSVTAIKLSVNE